MHSKRQLTGIIWRWKRTGASCNTHHKHGQKHTQQHAYCTADMWVDRPLRGCLLLPSRVPQAAQHMPAAARGWPCRVPCVRAGSRRRRAQPIRPGAPRERRRGGAVLRGRRAQQPPRRGESRVARCTAERQQRGAAAAERVACRVSHHRVVRSGGAQRNHQLPLMRRRLFWVTNPCMCGLLVLKASRLARSHTSAARQYGESAVWDAVGCVVCWLLTDRMPVKAASRSRCSATAA